MSKKARQKKRMGRPPLGIKAKREIIHVFVTKAELAGIEAEAKRLGVSPGQLLMLPRRKGE